MGLMAKLLSFTRVIRNDARVSDVKVDPGGRANLTAENYPPSGDDSHPLPNDFVAMTKVQHTGRYAAVGYVDPLNDPKAGPGDKRIYSRDSSGAVVAEIWLHSNGDIDVQNDDIKLSLLAGGSLKSANNTGFFELQSNGNFVVNGVIIDTNGNISSPSSVSAPSVSAAGKELAGHLHPAGDPPGNTGPNI